MLNLNELIGFGAGGEIVAPLAVSYVTRQTSTSTGTVHTWAGTSIGPVRSTTRKIVVLVWTTGSSITLVDAEMTIGGVAATREVGSSGSIRAVAAFSLDVPSGTTADIVLTMSAGNVPSGTIIDVYQVFGGPSIKEYAGFATTTTSNTLTRINVSLVEKGALLVLVATDSGTTSYTINPPAGMTLDLNSTPLTNKTAACASKLITTTETSDVTASCALTGAHRLLVVSYKPN